jgi:hypothetical protein
MYLHTVSAISQPDAFQGLSNEATRSAAAWREVINGPTYVGDLRSHIVQHGQERYNALTLFQSEAPVEGSAIPDLYEPVLLGFAPLAFRVRGYERVEAGSEHIGVVQEWHCELP